VELNGAVVLSLESVSRGRGNRGAVKLQKGKGRQRGSGAEAVLGVTAASRMGSGGAASDRRTEMKEERAEWAAKAGWGRWLGGLVLEMENKNENGVGLGCEGRLGRIQIGPLRKIENCFFEFVFQGNGIQIKSSEYFQAKFELDSK
jgi:hypothetical protein